MKLSKARRWQVQEREKWKIWQKWKICKTIPDGAGSMTEMLIWISQKEMCIGGADVTVKKVPTTIKIILLKKIQFYSESN
jgi:hypothetical protein